MFSFFKTKKHSPPSSPESDPIPSGGNDFVIVDQKQAPNPTPYPNPSSIYPNFDNSFGYPLPPVPVRPPLQHSDSIHPTTYVNDVPFKLSSELSTGDTNEITKIQVNDILAMITSKMTISQMDYDFTLERSLLAQSKDDDTTDSADADEETPAAEEDEEKEDEQE